MKTIPTARYFLLLFVGTAIPFGTYMARSEGIPAGIISGLVFGAWMSLTLGALHSSASKQSGNHVLSVEQSADFVFRGSYDEAVTAALDALRRIGVNVGKIPASRGAGITAKTRPTWKSFGEVLEIRFLPHGDREVFVTLSSRPWIRKTMADYGKNYENILAVKEAMLLAAPERGSRVNPT